MKFNAFKINQWRPEWNSFHLKNSKGEDITPEQSFYMFAMNANELRKLAAVDRRSTNPENKKDDVASQRQHDIKRSEEISTYINNGYPFSSLSKKDQASGEHDHLRKPGWLPTSILVNIQTDIKPVEKTGGIYEFDLPENSEGIFRIIDGQHRLLAFSEDEASTNYDLPVIGFLNLAPEWQAYLFWVINIRPKRISQSLAYDLYPLLRQAEWLQADHHNVVYRETRAQDIVSALWSHDFSPWFNKINILQTSGSVGITQASWMTALLNSLFHKNGIFETNEFKGNAAEQAALVIFFGNKIKESLAQASPEWAQKVCQSVKETWSKELEPSFYSNYSHLGTGTGIHALMNILNDEVHKFMGTNSDLIFQNWNLSAVDTAANEPEDVLRAINELESSPLGEYISKISKVLVQFDWRATKAISKSTERDAYDLSAGYRGASGFKQLKEKAEEYLDANI